MKILGKKKKVEFNNTDLEIKAKNKNIKNILSRKAQAKNFIESGWSKKNV